MSYPNSSPLVTPEGQRGAIKSSKWLKASHLKQAHQRLQFEMRLAPEILILILMLLIQNWGQVRETRAKKSQRRSEGPRLERTFAENPGVVFQSEGRRFLPIKCANGDQNFSEEDTHTQATRHFCCSASPHHWQRHWSGTGLPPAR